MPKVDIVLVALSVRELGAKFVTVRGECIVEPGTNEAALRKGHIAGSFGTQGPQLH